MKKIDKLFTLLSTVLSLIVSFFIKSFKDFEIIKEVLGHILRKKVGGLAILLKSFMKYINKN